VVGIFKRLFVRGTDYNKISPIRLRNFIDDTVIAFLKNIGIKAFEFSCDKENWLPYILNCLTGYSMKYGEQFVYGFDKTSFIIPPL